MKITKHVFLITIFLWVFVTISTAEISGNIKSKLEKIPGVESVEKVSNKAHFKEKYIVMFSQPNDHTDPESGTFLQRIFVCHTSFKTPMVIVTEGYTATYAESPYYSDEIASHFSFNEIIVEHRYFGNSVPDNIDWQYLTVENAAADHHKIIEAFKTLYTKKWLSTGISKGGSTCLIHRSIYPDDVDITVPYVAPLNFGLEDGRHEPYIVNISDVELRDRVQQFQMEILERRDSLMPMFKNYITKNGYKFRVPVDEVYDLSVLEYSFAFHQWGYTISSIPEMDATNESMFMHLMMVSPPDYFADVGLKGTTPFFIQAAMQLGYYGYDCTPFKGLLTIDNTYGYLLKVFLPNEIQPKFDVSAMNKVQDYLNLNDPKMIFIYGEYDPWSASGVVINDYKKKNMIKVINPQGSHASRIMSLPEEKKTMVLDKLETWLAE